MKTFKNFLNEGRKFFYDVYGIKGGKETKLDSLNQDEYNMYMAQNELKLVNKWPSIKVKRSDNKVIVYDSVGDKLVKRK